MASAGDGACLSWRAPEDEAPADRHAPHEQSDGGLYGDSLKTFGSLTLALKGLVNKYRVA